MIDTRLILIEGVPGSGKSTTANNVAADISALGIKCNCYLEWTEDNPIFIGNKEDLSEIISTQRYIFIFKICVVLFLFLFFPTGVFAEKSLVLNNQQDTCELPIHLDFLVDPTGDLSISEVSSDPWTEKYYPNTDRYPYFGFSKSVYWARLKIENRSKVTDWEIILFSSTMGMVDHIDLYEPDGNGGFLVFREGEDVPVAERRNREKSISSFLLSIPTDGVKTVYFRIRDEGLNRLPMYLYGPASIHSLNRVADFWYVMLGAIIFFFIYNLLLLSSLRDRAFLYYNIVLISYGLYILLGTIPAVFPLASAWWMNRLRGIVYLINGISWLLVTRVFFQNSWYGESVKKILMFFLGLFCVLILSYFFLPYPLVSRSVAGVWIGFSGVLVSISLFCWAKGFLAARYFSIGMLFLVVGWCGFYFETLGIISLSTWQLNSLMTVHFIVVLLFFSFALIDRYHIAEKKMLQHQKESLDVWCR